MLKHHRRRPGLGRFAAAGVVACALLLSGCSRDNAEKHVAAARAHLGKQDGKAAIIELKNALQQAPESGEARFLLGQALYEGGNPAGAVVELRKAREVHYDDSLAVPLLAQAMNGAGEARQLIDQFGTATLPTPAAQAALKAALAAARVVSGNREAARRDLAAALAADPDEPAARLLQARLQFDAGEADAAMRNVDALLAKRPAEADAWVAKAQLLRAAKADPQAVLAAYRQALSARKALLAAHSGIVTLLIERNELDAASAQLAEFRKYWPGTLQVKWFEAQLAAKRKDFKEAARVAEQLLAVAPNELRYLYFSASVALVNGAVLQADRWLAKALQLAPENVPVRQLLARTQLRQGQPAKALATLAPVLDKAPPDAQALSLAGQAQVLLGNAERAQQYFVQAAALDPSDTVSRTAVALAKASKGDGADGFDELREIAAADAGTAVDLQLIASLMRRHDVDGALKALDTLDRKQPNAALAQHLRGGVLLARQDRAAARAAFERALQIDPTYYLSVAALAAIDASEKKPEAARQRFERLLAADPKNMPATLALIELRASAGAPPAQLAEAIDNAVKLDPSALAPRLLLVDLWLRANDGKRALAAAQAGLAALPDNPRLLDALARAQFAAGAWSQAIGSYEKLAALQPQSPMPHLRIAEIHGSAKNTEAARPSLQRALALDPGLYAARSELAMIEVAAGNRKTALELAQALQKLRPADPAGLLLEGDIQQTPAPNWPAATAAYRKALVIDTGSTAAIKLHAALVAANQMAQADAFEAARLKERPRDAAFLFHLGESALLRKQLALAEARFADVVRLEPDSAVALNNLAWLMVAQQKKGGLAHAEKANQLQPQQPPFIDTLASALAFDGQLGKAVDLQQRLVDSRPQEARFRLHLAQLYLQSGDKPRARSELERLAALGDKFADKDEVARLLKAL